MHYSALFRTVTTDNPCVDPPNKKKTKKRKRKKSNLKEKVTKKKTIYTSTSTI